MCPLLHYTLFQVGLSVKEFIEAYDPFILDCTYD